MKDRLQTTTQSSEGYNNRLGNKKNIGKHPNFYQFVTSIVQELSISHDGAIAAEAGKPNTKPRERNVVRSERVVQDMDEDDEPLQYSRSGSIVIAVPALEDIVVPAQLIPPPAAASYLPPGGFLVYQVQAGCHWIRAAT